MIGALVASVALLADAGTAAAQSVQLTPFGGQTFISPWYVTGAPQDPSRVFVVEGGGTIRLVKDGVTQTTPFLTVPDVYTGCNDCGVFSMAFAPDYASSGLFYVMYTVAAGTSGQYNLRLDEFQRSVSDPDVADPASRRMVLEIPHPDSTIHNGGQLQFGPDGYLYISVGDGGPQGDPNGNAQNTGSLLGKLLRIDPAGTAPGQYSVPADNPFAGPTPGADEIYSYGLRNPWRFSFDRLTGDLTIGDVGFRDWEEIDFTQNGVGRGANFGWNCFEGNHLLSPTPADCSTLPANHTPPVLEYPHPATGPAAITGGYVIRDGSLPSLLGRYIYADIYDVFGGELRTAQLSAAGSTGDSGLGVSATNVVSFGEDACAHIYVVSAGGSIYRLEPAGGQALCAPEAGVSAGVPTPPAGQPGTATVTGRRAAAIRKCRKLNGAKRRKCMRRAKRLPI